MIAGGRDYDQGLRDAATFDSGAEKAHSLLLMEDIRMVADLLRPLYDRTEGADGYVTCRVDLSQGHCMEGMIGDARRLRALFNRPNVLIKVPATPEGLSVGEILVSEGLPIGFTMIGCLESYEGAAHAIFGASIDGWPRDEKQGRWPPSPPCG